jgi:predicted dehydrogenase
MTKTIKVGFVGVGQIGKHHLEMYKKIPGVEVAAIADVDPDRAKLIAEEYNIPDIYTNFRDLLKRDDIESVDVCLHNNFHMPVTVAALEAGKNVYCEKPMAGSYVDALKMFETAKSTGKMLHIQLSTLYSRETKVASELIQGGKLGKVYHGRSTGFRRRGRPFVDGYGSTAFVKKDTAAGGALYDMGVYHIACLLYLLGNPTVKTISGKTYQEIAMDEARKKKSGYNVEELGVGFVRFDNNLSLDIIEAWAIQMDKFDGPMIFGSDGGIRLEPFGFYWNVDDLSFNSSVDLDQYVWRKNTVQENQDVYESSQHHWIAVQQGRVNLLPTAELALKTMLISEGIYLSEQLGREVTADEVLKNSKSSAISL